MNLYSIIELTSYVRLCIFLCLTSSLFAVSCRPGSPGSGGNGPTASTLKSDDVTGCQTRRAGDWPRNAITHVDKGGESLCLKMEAFVSGSGDAGGEASDFFSLLRGIDRDTDFGENAMARTVLRYLGGEGSRRGLRNFGEATRVLFDAGYLGPSPLNLVYRVADLHRPLLEAGSDGDHAGDEAVDFVMGLYQELLRPCTPGLRDEEAGAGRTCLPDTFELPFELTKLSVQGEAPRDAWFSPIGFTERSVWHGATLAQSMAHISPSFRSILVRAYYVVGGTTHGEIDVNLWPKLIIIFQLVSSLALDTEAELRCTTALEPRVLLVDQCMGYLSEL